MNPQGIREASRHLYLEMKRRADEEPLAFSRAVLSTADPRVARAAIVHLATGLSKQD